MKMKILLAVVNMLMLIGLGVLTVMHKRQNDELAAALKVAAKFIDLSDSYEKQLNARTEELRRCRIEAFRLSQCILTNAPQ